MAFHVACETETRHLAHTIVACAIFHVGRRLATSHWCLATVEHGGLLALPYCVSRRSSGSSFLCRVVDSSSPPRIHPHSAALCPLGFAPFCIKPSSLRLPLPVPSHPHSIPPESSQRVAFGRHHGGGGTNIATKFVLEATPRVGNSISPKPDVFYLRAGL